MSLQRVPSADPTIRRMTLPDVDQVHAIEVLSYASPWSRESFVVEAQDREYALCLVLAEASPEGPDRERILGFICNWLVGDEMQVNNLAVHPDARRRGLGEILLRTALAGGIARGARVCYLDVRPTNTAARNLYTKLGFRECGTRPGYYQDSGEDAIVLRLVLQPGPRPVGRTP